MATKSILNKIVIKDKNSVRNLVDALEESKDNKVNNIVLTKTVNDVSKDKIKSIFGANN